MHDFKPEVRSAKFEGNTKYDIPIAGLRTSINLPTFCTSKRKKKKMATTTKKLNATAQEKSELRISKSEGNTKHDFKSEVRSSKFEGNTKYDIPVAGFRTNINLPTNHRR